MTKTEYARFSRQIVDGILNELNAKGLSDLNNEPLKDELLTAIDWHCAPKTD